MQTPPPDPSRSAAQRSAPFSMHSRCAGCSRIQSVLRHIRASRTTADCGVECTASTIAPACGGGSRTRIFPARRGVLLLEKAEVLNFTGQGISALRQTRDVGSAFLTLLLVQTWLTVFTSVMTIISIAFFSYGALLGML